MSAREVIQHPEYGELIKITRTSRRTEEEEIVYRGKHRMSSELWDYSVEEEAFDSVITQVCTVCGAENFTEPDAHTFWCGSCDMLTQHSGLSVLI